MTVPARIHGVKQLVARPTPPKKPITAAGQLPTGSVERRLFHNERKRSVFMFTRTVEVTAKSGKARELATVINDRVLPILRKQAGFVDETLLVSDTEPDRVLAISFWNKKEDAERYQKEQYPAVQEMIRHLLEAEPVVRTFNVDSSTQHNIAAGKAA
jgi:heme-degrading monooxygenase HmoA